MANGFTPQSSANEKIKRYLERSGFEIPTSSEKSFKSIMGNITSSQRAVKGIKALDKKPKPKEKQGILSRLFDQEKGILTAPARLVTAFTSSTLGGIGDVNNEMEGMNPFEAAYRSFKGEFAITGGDIIRVNDDDPFLERLTKYAGALALDIVTDPINYVGPVNLFSKKGAAVLAVRNGNQMLGVADDLLKQSGRANEATTLVDRLFDSTRLNQAAKAQIRLGIEVTPGSPVDILKMGTDGLVSSQIKASHAGSQLGLLVGESLLTGGRPKIRRTVAELLGSDDLAAKFMERLPTEVSGGIFLKNPVTGQPLKKIAGGRGAGGEAVEAINKARFALSALPPVNFLTENFSGKSGVVYANVKKGLASKLKPSDIDRTTLLDFVTFKDELQERGLFLSDLSQASARKVSGALATAKVYATDPTARGEYEAAFKAAFHSPRAPLSPNMSVAQQEGTAAAANLRTAIMDAHADLKAAGIEVGDLGPDFTPLMRTDEAHQKKLKMGYTGGARTETVAYSGGYGRRSLKERMPDPEQRKLAGFDDPKDPDVVNLSAVEANKRLRIAGKLADDELEYIEDPVVITQKYLEWANNSLSAKRFADRAAQTGAILKFPAEQRTFIETVDGQAFRDAVGKVSPQIAKRVEAVRNALDAKLRAALDPKELERVQNDVMLFRGETLTTFKDAQLALRGANQELLRANRAVEAAADRLRAATTEARNAAGGPNNVGALVQEAQRVYNNARSRLSKAANQAEQAKESYEFMASRLPLPGPSPELLDDNLTAWYDVLADTDVQVSRTQQRLNEEIITNQQAREELTRARELRQGVYDQLDEAQKRNFDMYEEALVVQERAAAIANSARARKDKALLDARAAVEDTTILRAQGLDALVNRYTRAKSEYLDIKMGMKKAYKDMTDDEKKIITEARDAMVKAHRELKEMLGYATKRAGAGAEYARLIVKLAEKLPEIEIEVARVISSTKRMNVLMDSLQDMSRDDALSTMENLYNTYKSIRRHVTPEELSALGEAEQAVLSGPFSGLTRKGRRMSRAAEELYSETGIAKIGSGPENVKLYLPKTLQDSFAPEGVRTAMERLYRAEQDPSEWQQWMSKIYDPAALVWKTGATVARGPAYAITNLVGALVMNFLYRVTHKSHRISAVVLNRVQTVLREVTKANPDKSYFELVEIAKERLEKEIGGIKVGDKSAIDLFSGFLGRGGHFSTDTFYQMNELQRLGMANIEPLSRRSGIQFRFDEASSGPIEDKYRAVVTFILNNPVQNVLNDFAQLSELFPRFAAYVDGYAKFGNEASAMDLVHMLHFDYQDLSNAEIWVKRFVPFYTWTRHNIPLQLRAAFLSSDQMLKLYNANNEAKEAFDIDGDAAWINDFLPDYMDINGGFSSYIKTGDGYLGLFPKLPMQDADRMFGTVFIGGIPIPWPRRDAIISTLGPIIKSPIELITNRNFELGYSYGSDMELLQGQTRTLIPYYGTAKRLLSAAGLPVDREKRLVNLLNVLVGAPYGATLISEKSIGQGARQTSEKLNAQLRAAADDANVDIDWLRDKLNKNVPLPQLMAMISTGQGARERVEMKKKLEEFMKPPSGKSYADVLGQLRSSDRGIPTYGS